MSGPSLVTTYDPFQSRDLSSYALAAWLPFVNVTAAPYFAKCDGVTDDTAAVQAAAAAMNALGGGIVQFPAGTCVCASSLNLNGYAGVWLRGVGQAKATVANGSVIKFTGSGAGSFITGQASQGIKISNLYVYASNTGAWTGTLINMDRGAGATDTANFSIVECTIGAVTDTSSVLLSMNKVIVSRIKGNVWSGGAVQISGLQAGGYSNAILIDDQNSFQSYTTAAIKNAGQGWSINHNTFEPGSGGIQKALQTTVLNVADGFDFSYNWIGDSTANNQNFVELSGGGVVLNGNYVAASSGAGNTAFKFVGNVVGMIAGGNFITNTVQTGFDFFGGTAGLSSGLVIRGNAIDSATPFTALPVNCSRTIANNRTSGGASISDWTTFVPTMTANGGATWSGGVVNYAKYKRDGNTMTVAVDISGTAVGTAAPSFLQILIPDGATSASRIFETLTATNNGVGVTGSKLVTVGGTIIFLAVGPYGAGGNWTQPSANTSVSFTFTFDVS